MKRATVIITVGYKSTVYFNPRPREEGDERLVGLVVTTTNISIHALVKRATYRHHAQLCNFAISIHALVKRATTCTAYDAVEYENFNPRPREEGDAIILVWPNV